MHFEDKLNQLELEFEQLTTPEKGPQIAPKSLIAEKLEMFFKKEDELLQTYFKINKDQEYYLDAAGDFRLMVDRLKMIKRKQSRNQLLDILQ
ncbi:hypothetical protein HDV01_002608 [Terramyces sp. JEL0728]|nr:hypothetical protein HDV01_002608 [Terramyces sp. JEL0728]